MARNIVDLNVGVGTHTNQLASPLNFDCINVDVLRIPSIDVICDVQHLPFKTGVFRDVFCFHVMEHTNRPAKSLLELIRVAYRLVELEVPHRLGRRAKSERWKKGDVSLSHLCSFKCMWFHNFLKNYIYCLKVLYTFPRDLEIHVWIYLIESRKQIEFSERCKNSCLDLSYETRKKSVNHRD